MAASAEGALGLLAATSGRADDAVSHLEVALDREQALGLRPVALRTRLLLAGVLSRRDRPGDPARAAALRRDAEGGADGLGCPLPAAIGAGPSLGG